MGGKPVYGVKTSSGVSAACLPSYFEALDAYRQRLENEVGFHAAKIGTNTGTVSKTNQQSETLQEQTLKTHGCICTSPHLEFSTSDANTKKSHPQDLDTTILKDFTEVTHTMRRWHTATQEQEPLLHQPQLRSQSFSSLKIRRNSGCLDQH